MRPEAPLRTCTQFARGVRGSLSQHVTAIAAAGVFPAHCPAPPWRGAGADGRYISATTGKAMYFLSANQTPRVSGAD